MGKFWSSDKERFLLCFQVFLACVRAIYIISVIKYSVKILSIFRLKLNNVFNAPKG